MNARVLVVLLVSLTLVTGCKKEASHNGKTVSQWRKLLKSSDAGERSEAATALGELGEQAKSAIPDLRTALNDADAHVRLQAICALWAMGSCAQDCHVDFAAALRSDRDPEVRAAAAGAFADLVHHGSNVDPLAEALQDPQASVRLAAAKAITKLGRQAKSASGALNDALQDKDQNVRNAVVYALAEMGAEARVARAKIIDLANARQIDIEAAKHALARIPAK